MSYNELIAVGIWEGSGNFVKYIEI